MIDNPDKQRLAKRKEIYDLHNATLIIQQGFSINDVSKDLTQPERYQAEINRLKTELGLIVQKQDSITRTKKIGNSLFQEMKPLFPEVRYCSADKQTFYTSANTAKHFNVVVLGTTNSKKTNRDLSRINKWLKIRFKSDSVKLYVEKSTF